MAKAFLRLSTRLKTMIHTDIEVLVMKEVNKIYEINDNMTMEEFAEIFAWLRNSTEETALVSDEDKRERKSLVL